MLGLKSRATTDHLQATFRILIPLNMSSFSLPHIKPMNLMKLWEGPFQCSVFHQYKINQTQYLSVLKFFEYNNVSIFLNKSRCDVKKKSLYNDQSVLFSGGKHGIRIEQMRNIPFLLKGQWNSFWLFGGKFSLGICQCLETLPGNLNASCPLQVRTRAKMSTEKESSFKIKWMIKQHVGKERLWSIKISLVDYINGSVCLHFVNLILP